VDEAIDIREEIPRCATCLELLARVEPEEYRCPYGRFDKSKPRWFALVGINKPNETVAQAQKRCPHYKPQI
jgi:hypothetical protein